MTIAVDLGRKATKTNKQTKYLISTFNPFQTIGNFNIAAYNKVSMTIVYIEWVQVIVSKIYCIFFEDREHSGSEVEYLTRD